MLDYEIVYNYMINYFSALAYPSIVCCMSCVCGFLFCDDHQFIDVSRCEEHRWSTRRWWFRCLAFELAFAFGFLF